MAEGLRARWGRKVLEIRPPVDADKGTAVRQLLTESAPPALYAGDDTTDLDAFAALDGLERACAWRSVGGSAGGARRAADLCLDGPRALAEVLGRL